jgi:hypothetical protein
MPCRLHLIAIGLLAFSGGCDRGRHSSGAFVDSGKIAGTDPADSTAAVSDSAGDSVLTQLRLHGPAKVFKGLGDPWSFHVRYLEAMWSGDSAWLEVARQLRSVTDGGSAEQLTGVTALALLAAPERVLRQVRDTSELDDACNPSWLSERDSFAEQHRRKGTAALKRVKASDLLPKRDACLKLMLDTLRH